MLNLTVNELRVNIGVTEDVAKQMVAVQASVLSEDGLLLRVCEHGVRHPVGWLESANRYGPTLGSKDRHERRASFMQEYTSCCTEQCCLGWG